MRLFTALSIPENISSLLSGFIGGGTEVRWLEPHDYHLTLTFHESVSHEEFFGLISILDLIEFEPFSLTLNGIGMFPFKDGAIIWAAVKESRELLNLQTEISESLFREGFNHDRKKFKPHITLGRSKDLSPIELESILQRGTYIQEESFLVESFSLYSSQLTPSGAVYTEEERFTSL